MSHALLVNLTDFGMVNGHHLQGSEQPSLLLVDGTRIIACTPAEYRIAALLLHAPGKPVPLAQFAHRSRHRLANQVSRLRRKVAPLGITIVSVKTYGYLALLTPQAASPDGLA